MARQCYKNISLCACQGKLFTRLHLYLLTLTSTNIDTCHNELNVLVNHAPQHTPYIDPFLGSVEPSQFLIKFEGRFGGV